MIRYSNGRRVVIRTQPDPWLDASSRWNRVVPLSLVPLPDRAPEQDKPTPVRAPEPDKPTPVQVTEGLRALYVPALEHDDD